MLRPLASRIHDILKYQKWTQQKQSQAKKEENYCANKLFFVYYLYITCAHTFVTSTPTEVFLHDRILDKALLWMIPRWVTPNSITWLRFFLVPFVVYINYRGNYAVGVPLFLFAAFTDAVDGSLARTRDQITNFGKLFDPFADKLLIGSMVVLLVFKYLSQKIGYIVVGLEILFIVVGTVQWLLGKVSQANLWGKIKMLLQVLAVCLILLGLTFGYPILFACATWIFGAAIIFACISLFFHGI